MAYKNISNPLNIVVYLIGILLLSYTGYRSYALSFTHDESYSFIHYVHSSVLDILTYNLDPIIANSHPLNTLSMKWMGALFGNSEFILRFHSFIAHFIYLIFTYLILKESQSKVIILFGFIILNCNPYLLDFFSLARGYALSISFMIMSIYYFIKYNHNSNKKHMYVSLLTSILGVLANFSLISYAISLIFVFELVFIIKKENRRSIILNNISLGLSFFALVLIYVGPIKVLIDHHELNFGGSFGLWDDTVMSSIAAYTYSSPFSDVTTLFLKYLVIFTSIVSLIVLFIQFKTKIISGFSYISILLILILISNVLQHLLFQGSYFKERFALFLVPLFFFSLINSVQFLSQNKNRIIQYFSIGSISLVMFCSFFVFLTAANLNYCYSWKYDADTKRMLEVLSKEKQNHQKIKLGITWLFEPTINFYKETKSLDWLNHATRDGLNGDYDFYYVESNDLNSFDKTNKILIKDYLISGSTLFKKVKEY